MRWLPEVSKAARTAWRTSPQTRRAAIGGAAIAALAVGMGVCTGLSRMGALPGLEALRRVLPDFQRRHPAGLVQVLTASGDGLIDGTATHWNVVVWIRDLEANTQATLNYVITRGRLSGRPVATSSGPTTPGASPRLGFLPLDGSPVPPFLDSDAAVRIAEEAGARAFRERTGVTVRDVGLFPDRERGSVYVWGVTYFGSGSGAALGVAVDARTGEVLSYNEST